MVSLSALWIPIVVSAVFVFIASSIMHMMLPYHKSDHKQLPDEDNVMAALRSAKAGRGVYMFPFCTHQNMKDPAMVEKRKQGPVGILTVLPSGDINMGPYLAKWFTFCLLVGFFVAYLAAHTLPAGTHYRAVFRIVGTAAFLAYGLGNLPNAIWKGQPASNVIKEVVDGLVYGLLTAGTFGWLWPKA